MIKEDFIDGSNLWELPTREIQHLHARVLEEKGRWIRPVAIAEWEESDEPGFPPVRIVRFWKVRVSGEPKKGYFKADDYEKVLLKAIEEIRKELAEEGIEWTYPGPKLMEGWE